MTAYTGGKYASTTITTVGTTTVTASGAAFASGDFSSTRIVGLWNSAGTTFLGMAWVRAWVSATQLQLQSAFFDPATGATVTQAVGQIILVSKNFNDISATGGVTVTAPNQATFTAAPTFGASGSSTGVCFYDEGYEIVCPYTISISGGLTVLGKLDGPTKTTVGSNSYTSGTLSSPCDIDFAGLSGTSEGIYTVDANSNFWMNGGQLNGQNSPIYNGGYQGTTGYTFILNGVQSPYDLISPGAGGSWGSNQSRQQLINCLSITTGSNAICRRWGDGLQIGGAFKFPNNTNQPISALGSDSTGTYSFAAAPGQRAYVLDFGANSAGASSTGAPVLFRSGVAVTLNCTNLIASNYYQGQGQTQSGSVTANSSGVTNVYFQDTYSGLQALTVGVIQLAGTTVASSAATGTSWSPSLLYETVTGFTTTTGPNTSWSYGLKCYGYQAVSGTISATTYSFGSAGSGPNVSFGGAVNQLTDTSLASTGISQATANAYTSIATLDQLYAAAVNWATLSTTNAAYPSLGAYPITYSGSQLNLGALNLVVNNTGSAFAINTSTNTLTINAAALASGTVFTSFTTTGSVTVNTGSITCSYTSSAGTSAQLNLTGLVASSYVYVENASGTQQVYVSGQSGTYTLNIAPGASSGSWKWATKALGYSSVSGSFTPSAGGTTTVAATGVLKQGPDGSTSYQGSTNSLVTYSFTGTTEADILIGNGAVSDQNVFDASENALVTAAGLHWLANGKGEMALYLSFVGNFLFMPSGWRLKALNTSSPNAAVLAYAISTDGTPVNGANGNVTIGISASGTITQIATGVWAYSLSNGNTAGANLNTAGTNAGLIPALL